MAVLELENLQAFKTLEGKPIPTGEWLVVTQEMIEQFIQNWVPAEIAVE